MLSEIVIFANNKTQAKTKLKLAQQIVKKIKSGVSFEEMVSQFSQAGSASNKGHLGWVYAAQLMPELANVIKTVQIGEVTPPMIMEDGIHILKIKDRKSNRKSQNVELDDDQIKNILSQRKLEVLVRSRLMQMRNRAFIKINIKTS